MKISKIEALEEAIDKAQTLNADATDMLRKAIEAVSGDLELADDYRFKFAVRMLNVCFRQSNIAMPFYLARRRNSAKAARAGK